MRHCNTPITFSITMGVLASLVQASAAFAQTSTYSLASLPGLPSLIQTFQQQNTVLCQQDSALNDEGASPAQMNAWEDQNLASFQALDLTAQEISAYSAVQPLDYISNVPAGTFPQEQTLMIATASLLNDFAQIHNQVFQGLQLNFSLQAVANAEEDVDDLFNQQYDAQLQTLSGQVDAVHQVTVHQPINLPTPPAIPINASPQLRNYIMACYRLETSEIQTHNQYCGGTPAQIDAAQEQWEEQNDAFISQVSQMGEAINSTPQN